jgi:hypothetical protein
VKAWLRRGAVVLLIWGLMNAVLAAVLVFFAGETKALELELYWASTGMLLILAAIVFVPDAEAHHRQTSATAGAPALAFAAACLFGGLAWVFGRYLAFLALPPLAFCVGRWRLERQQ